MRWPTSWNDTVKAAALATQAKRTATAVRIAVDAPWSWNPHAVWLSRVRPSRELEAQSSEQAVPPRRRTARHG